MGDQEHFVESDLAVVQAALVDIREAIDDLGPTWAVSRIREILDQLAAGGYLGGDRG